MTLNPAVGSSCKLLHMYMVEKPEQAIFSKVLSEPPLLLCDEVTSGLDSWMAENVGNYMR
jgi:ABC-type lipoprotein export system ATPase subunit